MKGNKLGEKSTISGAASAIGGYGLIALGVPPEAALMIGSAIVGLLPDSWFGFAEK